MRSLAVRLALVVVATLFTLGVLEGILRVGEDDAEVAFRVARRPYQTVPDPVVGYRPSPLSSFRATLKFPDGEVCYDVVYKADAFGRRDVGLVDVPGRDRLLLFGCSYTFGEGLSDRDTLPYQLGSRFNVTNYAVHGYGPQQTLALMRSGRPQGEVREPEAIGVYFFYPFQLERAVVTSTTRWLYDSPFFEIDWDDHLRGFPSYAARHPWRTAVYRRMDAWNERWALLRRFPLRWPLREDPQRAELTAAILIESSSRFEQRWQRPLTIAVVGSQQDPEAVRELITRLRAAGVPVLDYSEREPSPDERLCYPRDLHPNGRFTRELADRLLRDLPHQPPGVVLLPRGSAGSGANADPPGRGRKASLTGDPARWASS